MEEVEVAATEKTLMLLKYLEHQIRLLEEVEEVAMKEETQKEFLVRHVSFFSFYELPPNQLDVDLNNITLMTSVEPHTMGRSLKRARSRACIAWSTASVTISSTAWLTLWGILRFSKLYSQLPCSGGRRVGVVVMIVEIVAIDVGRGESNCDFVRSIIGMVIGGTEEVS
ncbi:hypothetical protein Tco_1182132 [Tanacetum coccineum]